MNLIQREPVRVYLYGLALALVALLVAYGIVDAERAPLWIAAVTALLAVPVVEQARSKVTPVAAAEPQPGVDADLSNLDRLDGVGQPQRRVDAEPTAPWDGQ